MEFVVTKWSSTLIGFSFCCCIHLVILLTVQDEKLSPAFAPFHEYLLFCHSAKVRMLLSAPLSLSLSLSFSLSLSLSLSLSHTHTHTHTLSLSLSLSLSLPPSLSCTQARKSFPWPFFITPARKRKLWLSACRCVLIIIACTGCTEAKRRSSDGP